MSTPPDQPLVPPRNPDPAAADPWQGPGPQPPDPLPTPPPTAAGYPPASPYWATDWVQPPPPAWGGPQPYAAPGSDAALRKAGTALGWAVGATVGAFLAMLLAVGALLATAASSDDFAYEPLRSRVDGLTAGGALAGDTLEQPLTELLRDVGSFDVDISCPDTDEVDVSTAVVCTGDVDGSAWTGIVFFEDADGTFVVLEV